MAESTDNIPPQTPTDPPVETAAERKRRLGAARYHKWLAAHSVDPEWLKAHQEKMLEYRRAWKAARDREFKELKAIVANIAATTSAVAK